MKILFFALILLSACSQMQKDMSKQAAQEIITTDKSMSDLAVKEGFFHTLLKFADENVVKPQEREYPVIGRQNLEKYWSGKPDTKNISWVPFKAEASKSGDMGYSLGDWKLTTQDTTYYGNYYTIWKRQNDGSWKFVVDGGNGTPAPRK